MNLTTTAGKNFTGGTGFPAYVSLTVSVTGTPFGGAAGTYEGPTIWLEESATNTAENIALLFDIGSMPGGPGSVTSVSVLATT